MRFAAAALLLAGAVMADTTAYVTDVITITSCHPTVTYCPAQSTVTSTTSYPVVNTKYTTVASTIYACPSSVTNCPYRYMNATTVQPVPVTTVYPNPVTTVPVVPGVVTVTVSACPSSTTLISRIPTPSSYTTPSSPKFTGAASAVSGSFALAGFAGLAAIFLA